MGLLRRLPGIDSGVRRSVWWEGGGRVLGISTILHASAVQIKCKLKLGALPLSKGDSDLLLISLLCKAGTAGLQGAVMSRGGREYREERAALGSAVDLNIGSFCLMCMCSMALLRRAEGSTFTLKFSLHLETREFWEKGDVGLTGLRLRFPWGRGMGTLSGESGELYLGRSCKLLPSKET